MSGGQQTGQAQREAELIVPHAAAGRWQLNASRLVLAAETFASDRHRITGGGLLARVHRVPADQDVEWLDAP